MSLLLLFLPGNDGEPPVEPPVIPEPGVPEDPTPPEPVPNYKWAREEKIPSSE